MTGERIDRSGLNRAEAGFVRAAVAFGGGVDLLQALEAGPAEALEPVLERIEALEAEQRERVVDSWPDEGCGAEELRADEPGHFDALLGVEPDRFRRLAGDFGVYQLALLFEPENRRRVARTAGKLGARRRRLMMEALDREGRRVERARVREVFVTLSERVEGFRARVEHLGIYAIACAAGRRYRGRVVRLVERLPGELGRPLRRYYRLSQVSSRCGVGRRFRASLEEFLASEALPRQPAESGCREGEAR